MEARLHEEYSGCAGEPNIVDIVAVQGLQSAYERTWSIKIDRSTHERYHWLRSKLPIDVPNARITAFEYPSRWYDRNPDHTSLEECARQLLRCLIQDRCHVGEARICSTRRKRPIVLIGHSFGGLVIKRALMLASQTRDVEIDFGIASTRYLNAQDILSCVAGVIFLGTPHKGSNFSRWASLKSTVLGTITGTPSNPELIHLLRLDSALLLDVQSQFSALQRTSELSKLKIYCFYEKQDVQPLGQRVVTEASACLDGAINAGLDANHMQLNKFKQASDSNYMAVKDAIADVIQRAQEIVALRFDDRTYGSIRSSPDLQRVQQWLAPSTRAQAIQFKNKSRSQEENSSTCQWLGTQDSFSAWRSCNSKGTLCVHGKPGSGKSVLAAFAIKLLQGNIGPVFPNNTRQEEICQSISESRSCSNVQHAATILYFFCGVDPAHETLENFLGTLVHQVLLLHNHDHRLLSLVRRYSEDTAVASHGILCDLIVKISKTLGEVYIVVDGIEESKCFADCLKSLSQLHRAAPLCIRLLLLYQEQSSASRLIHNLFPGIDGISMVNHNTNDIEDYIEKGVQELLSYKPHLKSQERKIHDTLVNGAQGMFQWVKCSLDQLFLYATLECLDAILEDLPVELERTWERVFVRLNAEPGRRRKRVQLLLQWLCVAARPLSSLDLHTVLQLEQGLDASPGLDFERVLPSVSDRTSVAIINDYLGSLAQINIGPDGLHYVQLAHNSLNLALTADRDRPDQSPIVGWGFTPQAAHRSVALMCMRYCSASTFAFANAFGGPLDYLVKYSWEYWSYHLKLSGTYLNNSEVRETFDGMVIKVTRDTTSFLIALADFVSQPTKVRSWSNRDIEHIVCLQRAQDALITPIENLTLVRKVLPCSNALEQVRAYYTATRKTAFNINVNHNKMGVRFANRLRKIKAWWLDNNTTVTSSKAEDLTLVRYLIGTPVTPGRLLWASAKTLRFLALRFAVNPLYAHLIESARGCSFSPIHLLVYTAALLDECGNYPFWADLPLRTDALDPFITAPSDNQHGHARFVLHCSMYRDTGITAGNAYPDDPTPLSITANRPDASGAPESFPISAAHVQLVKKSHQLPPTLFQAELHRLQVFSGGNKFIKILVTNPLGNWHLQNKLKLSRHESSRGALGDPTLGLARSALASRLSYNPAQWFRGLPQMMESSFVTYIFELFIKFGNATKNQIILENMQLQIAKHTFYQFQQFVTRIVEPSSPIDILPVILGALLYAIRCRYFHEIGASIAALPWHDFRHCLYHPAQYLDMQLPFHFWGLFKCFVMLLAHDSVGNIARIYLQQLPANVETFTAWFTVSISAYSLLVELERAVHQFVSTLCKTIATALLIFHDSDSFRNLVLYSFSYWSKSFIAIFSFLIYSSVLGNSLKRILIATTTQVIFLFAVLRLCDELGGILSSALGPLMKPFWLMLLASVPNYAFLLRLSGVLLFVWMVWRTFCIVDGWIWDPFRISESVVRLHNACDNARSNLPGLLEKRIGTYPFGGVQDITGSQDAPTTEEDNSLPPPRNDQLSFGQIAPRHTKSENRVDSSRHSSKSLVEFTVGDSKKQTSVPFNQSELDSMFGTAVGYGRGENGQGESMVFGGERP